MLALLCCAAQNAAPRQICAWHRENAQRRLKPADALRIHSEHQQCMRLQWQQLDRYAHFTRFSPEGVHVRAAMCMHQAAAAAGHQPPYVSTYGRIRIVTGHAGIAGQHYRTCLCWTRQMYQETTAAALV